MRLLTTFPGQEPRVIEAPQHILDHIRVKGYVPPFYEVIEGEPTDASSQERSSVPDPCVVRAA